jgi:hypothetical protein
MIVLMWLLSLVLLLLGAWITIANWVITFRTKGGSPIPIVGGVFMAIALVMIPLDALHRFWWLPLIVDLGCLPMLVLTGGYLAWRALAKRN